MFVTQPHFKSIEGDNLISYHLLVRVASQTLFVRSGRGETGAIYNTLLVLEIEANYTTEASLDVCRVAIIRVIKITIYHSARSNNLWLLCHNAFSDSKRRRLYFCYKETRVRTVFLCL